MKSISNNIYRVFILLGIICLQMAGAYGQAPATPGIVNIVNFIRLLEPRDRVVTEDVLYQAVVKQVAIMKQYNLGQYFYITVRRVDESAVPKAVEGAAARLV